MKIKNNLVLVLSLIALILGIFDGSIAYQEEIDRILTYTTNYESFTKNITLFVYLFLRYFKYILIVQFFSLGYFGKLVTVLTAMVKCYAYGFTIALIVVSFNGIELLKKLSFISVQMTISLIVTIVFSQVTMNYIEDKYPVNKKTQIQLYAFVFSLICCIIIGTIDFVIIKMMN